MISLDNHPSLKKCLDVYENIYIYILNNYFRCASSQSAYQRKSEISVSFHLKVIGITPKSMRVLHEPQRIFLNFKTLVYSDISIYQYKIILKRLRLFLIPYYFYSVSAWIFHINRQKKISSLATEEIRIESISLPNANTQQYHF